MNILSNTPPPADSRELLKHFSKTYLALRGGLFLLALTMPVVLYLYGKFRHGLDLQPSMSAYFWAANEGQCASFPMRTIFIGYLFAIGAGMIAYKGLTKLENTLFNAAGICAFFVATFPERLVPEDATNDPRLGDLFLNCPAVKVWAEQPQFPIHWIAAVVLFVLLAIVAWFCAKKSLEYLPAGHYPKVFLNIYKAIAIAMLLFPGVGIAVSFLLDATNSKMFFIEAAGVLTFATYWAVKTRELSLSKLEEDPGTAVDFARQRHTIEKQMDEHDTLE
jgi:hypothetical protein